MFKTSYYSKEKKEEKKIYIKNLILQINYTIHFFFEMDGCDATELIEFSRGNY
jgi:hypothetical protein